MGCCTERVKGTEATTEIALVNGSGDPQMYAETQQSIQDTLNSMGDEPSSKRSFGQMKNDDAEDDATQRETPSKAKTPEKGRGDAETSSDDDSPSNQ